MNDLSEMVDSVDHSILSEILSSPDIPENETETMSEEVQCRDAYMHMLCMIYILYRILIES